LNKMDYLLQLPQHPLVHLAELQLSLLVVPRALLAVPQVLPHPRPLPQLPSSHLRLQLQLVESSPLSPRRREHPRLPQLQLLCPRQSHQQFLAPKPRLKSRLHPHQLAQEPLEPALLSLQELPARPKESGTASVELPTNNVRAVPGLLRCNSQPALPALLGSQPTSTSPPARRERGPSGSPAPISVAISKSPRLLFYRRSISKVILSLHFGWRLGRNIRVHTLFELRRLQGWWLVHLQSFL